MKKLVKPHDPLSRKFLTDLSIAKEFVTAYLLPEVLAKCNLNSLVIESGSYIEEDLRAHYADIVYKVDLLENVGNAYIYVLIEHQSSAEELMPYRIIKYQLAVMQKHLDQNKKTKSLPLVVPLVFYNGADSPYPYSTDIADLFMDKEIYNRIGLGKFGLVDLTVSEDRKLLQHGKLSVLEVLLKHIRERDFTLEIAEVIVKALIIAKRLDINNSLVNASFSYLVSAREYEDIRQLTQLIKKNELSEYMENIMSYAEQLKQEGWQKGHLEGISKGMQEGINKGLQEGIISGIDKGKLEVAKNLKILGISDKMIAQATGIALAQIKSLKLK